MYRPRNTINIRKTKKGGNNVVQAQTIYINGDEVVGIKPYYELKDLLIEHGAKPRK